MSHSGIVRFYNVKNSYGFIGVEQPQPGNDIFVHKTGIVGNILKEGDKVSFNIATGDDGRLKAENVTGGSGMTFEEAEERFRNRRGRFRGRGRGRGRGGGRGRGRGYGGDNFRGGYENDGGYRERNSYNSRPRGPPGICFQFRDNGSCRFDQDCRFSHDLSGSPQGQPPVQQMQPQVQQQVPQPQVIQEAQI